MNKKERLYFNNRLVEKTKKRMEEYDLDSNKKHRIELCECKFCTYINNSRIAGSAFTESKCTSCGKNMIFPSTDTDDYCIDCAKKLNVCKHCGSIMD